MPDSAMKLPRGGRHTVLLASWLLITINSVWTYGPPMGLPGEPGSAGRGPETIYCPKCRNLAKRQLDDSYKCTKDSRHVSKALPDGTYELTGDSR